VQYDQSIVDAAFTLTFLLLSFILHVLWGAVKNLQEKLQHIELLVTGDYVKKNEMAACLESLEKKLDKIDAKLERNSLQIASSHPGGFDDSKR
jgi:hypothetical protein